MENMDFKSYILEEKDKTAVFAFGRMNPPTTGHEKLVSKVHDLAKENKAHHVVVLSHTQDSKKNPLSTEQKLTHAKRFFPRTNIQVSSKEHPSLIQHAKKLYDQGHQHLIMVAGSDRTDEYHTLLHKYNGKQDHYNFKSIKVVSAGQRDPDAEGAEGMSASKMRDHAKGGSFADFKQGIPGHVKTSHARELYNDVRHGLSLKESKDTRQRYIEGQIYNVGDKVCFEEGMGEIVFKGPTYLTIELSEGVTTKKWMHEVKDIDEGWTQPRIAGFANIASNKVPAILMTSEQRQKLQEAASQLTYNNYSTSNLDICPSAKKHLAAMIKREELNPVLVMQAVVSTDDYLGVEKEATKQGFADQEMVHEFVKDLSLAHSAFHIAGYSDSDLQYLKGHIKIMSKLSVRRDGTFVDKSRMEEETTEIMFTSADGKSKTTKIEAPTINKKDREDKMTIKKFKSIRNEELQVENNDVDMKNKERDINKTPEKDVYDGIDKPEAGMSSFKTFLMQNPDKGQATAAHAQDKSDIHTAVVKNFQAHSPAYPQMKKAQQQG